MKKRRIGLDAIQGARVEIHEQEVHTGCPGGHAPYAATVTLADGRVWETRDIRNGNGDTVDKIDVSWPDGGATPLVSGLDIREVTSEPRLWADLPRVKTEDLLDALGLSKKECA